MKKFKIIILILLCLWMTFAQADTNSLVMQNEFIKKMESQYNFDSTYLKNLFDQVIVSETILKAISKPAEKRLSWYKYKDIFFDMHCISLY